MSTTSTYAAKTFTTGETLLASDMNVLDAGVYDTHYANAGAHNSIYRGKSLGTAITSTQAGYISDATFTDLFVGDYWTINSIVYHIAGFDYLYKCGQTSLTTHHAVMVPTAHIGVTSPMNATATTSGAYVGSGMYTCTEMTTSSGTYTGLTDAITAVESAFGSYVLTFSGYYANAATNGYPSAQAWCTDRVCDLMTEQMVFGSAVMQQMSAAGSMVANRRLGKSQLPIFALNPAQINVRAEYWLQDVITSTYFTYVSGYGTVSASSASSAFRVRPFFLIS